MLFRLILLLTVVPFIELWILIQLDRSAAHAWGESIGLAVTFGTIVLTGVLGATLGAGRASARSVPSRKRPPGGNSPATA